MNGQGTAMDSKQAISVKGGIPPGRLGRVMMHEHLHSDLWDWEKGELIVTEHPPTPERREYLLKNAVPHLKRAKEEFGMNAYVDVTMPPWRAWPDLYTEVSELSGVEIIMATGFYREMEVGKYYVKRPEDAIWPFVRESSVEELEEMCVREIVEGIHGTGIRAGVIKLGTSCAAMTDAEVKTFRAGGRAQKKTGVHITTHCTKLGAETSQLTILDQEGVNLERVVIGHANGQLMSPDYFKTTIDWMKRGVNFLPTNLRVLKGEDGRKIWQPLVDAIHRVFDAGLGHQLVLGLDSGYCSEAGPLQPMTFLPPDPWCYLFTDILPLFRSLGLTEDEENAMLVKNPARIIPVEG